MPYLGCNPYFVQKKYLFHFGYTFFLKWCKGRALSNMLSHTSALAQEHKSEQRWLLGCLAKMEHDLLSSFKCSCADWYGPVTIVQVWSIFLNSKCFGWILVVLQPLQHYLTMRMYTSFMSHIVSLPLINSFLLRFIYSNSYLSKLKSTPPNSLSRSSIISSRLVVATSEKGLILNK